MADVGFVVFLAAFFAVAAGFVVACDKIIGAPAEAELTDAESEDVAA